MEKLEDGLYYYMRDPLRWLRKYQLIKRGYTLDTWDFMQLSTNREEFIEAGGDVKERREYYGSHIPQAEIR